MEYGSQAVQINLHGAKMSAKMVKLVLYKQMKNGWVNKALRFQILFYQFKVARFIKLRFSNEFSGSSYKVEAFYSIMVHCFVHIKLVCLLSNPYMQSSIHLSSQKSRLLQHHNQALLMTNIETYLVASEVNDNSEIGNSIMQRIETELKSQAMRNHWEPSIPVYETSQTDKEPQKYYSYRTNDQQSDEDEWNQQATSKNKLKFQQAKHYPENCVFRVYCVFQAPNGKRKTIQGVGFLITYQFLMTCLHLTYYWFEDYKKRLKAVQVYILHNGEKIACQFHIDETKTFQRKLPNQVDYTLLLLTKPIQLPKYLRITNGYKTDNKICIILIKKNGEYQQPMLQFLEQVKQIKDQYILNHSFITIHGDSGSPILVVFPQIQGQFFVICLHSRQKKSQTKEEVKGKDKNDTEGKSDKFSIPQKQQIDPQLLLSKANKNSIKMQKRCATKLNAPIIESLHRLAKKLTKKKYSYIKNIAVLYEEPNRIMKNTIKQLNEYKNQRLNHQDFFGIHLIQMFNKSLLLQNGQNIIRKQIYQRLFELIQRFLEFYARWHFEDFQQDMRVNFLPVAEQLSDFSKEYLTYGQKDCKYLKQLADMFLIIIAPEKYGKQGYNQRVLGYDFVEYISDFCDSMKIQWQDLAHWIKFLIYHEKFKIQYQVEYCIDIPFNKFASLIQWGLNCLNLNFMMKPETFIYCDAQFGDSSRRQIIPQPEVIRLFTELPTPYCSFVKDSFSYNINNNKVFQYSYKVYFPSIQQVKKTIWQQIRFFQSDFEFINLKRGYAPESNTFFLAAKFRTVNSITLPSYLQKVKSYSCSFLYILLIFHSVVKFVESLHNQGLVLYSPLQFCLFMRRYNGQPELWPYFFYFGSAEALENRIRQIGSELFSRRNLQSMYKLGEYYPIDEVLHKQTSVENCQKIDVWILGKSFLRCLKSLELYPWFKIKGYYPQQKGLEIQGLQVLQQLIDWMTHKEMNKRLSIDKVKEKVTYLARIFYNRPNAFDK